MARALALQRAGRTAEAEGLLRDMAREWPSRADSRYFLGILLYRSGRMEEALRLLAEATRMAPTDAEYATNLAIVLAETGRIGEALAAFRHAVAVDPDHAPAQVGLAAALAEAGDLEAAEAACRRALSRRPDDPEILRELGLLLALAGKGAEALGCFRRALDRAPDDGRLEADLGAALLERGEATSALPHLRRARDLGIDEPGLFCNLGVALNHLNRLDDAAQAYRSALALDPDDGDAAAQLFHLAQRLCDWTETEALAARLDAQTAEALAAGRRPGETPFISIARQANPARNQAVARAWAAETAARAAPLRAALAAPHPRRPEERLTLGYLSANFHDHPTAYNTHRLMASHDRTRFRVVAYSCGPDDGSPIRAKVREACDGFVDLATVGHAEAAARIRADEVDILVGLLGHTAGSRLEIAALRPAPLQVAYLTFPGPAGGAGIFDYVLADRQVIPEGHRRWHDEAVAWLPDSYWPVDEGQRVPPAPSREAAGLPPDALVFSSLNQPHKIEPVMFDAWMRILRAVPEGRLWLMAAHPRAEANLRRAAQAAGVDPARLIFAAKKGKEENLARLRLADLALDTRVYGGHTTTVDALWAGVPVVTLRGGHFASRVSASILSAAGLEDLVTDSLEAYVDLAVGLARNPEVLRSTRERVAAAAGTQPFFDTPRLARNMEALFRRMWDRFLAGEPPAHLE